jgi:predicted  nucleic acid-binding Zn-ribbon protein
MARANKALVVLVVAVVGLWGCAQRPAPGGLERIKSLEAKIAKLEDDYKAAASARDQARKKLADAEEQRGKLQQDLEQQQQEFKQQVATRTAERDALQSQFESFRKGVRSLLNQADTAASALTPAPALSATDAPPGGKS